MPLQNIRFVQILHVLIVSRHIGSIGADPALERFTEWSGVAVFSKATVAKAS